MARAPIDYTLNVINPIQAAMEGYSFGLREVQAEKDEARNVERFGMEKEKFAMAQRAEADRRAAAARSAAAAQRSEARKQSFYNDFSRVVNGEISRKELLANYPDFASTMKSTFDLIPNDVADARVATGKRIQNALNSGRTDIAEQLLDEQIAAARNTPGQENLARQLEVMKDQMGESPRMVFEEIGLQIEGFGDEGLEWRGETVDQPAEVRELQFRAEQGGLVPGTPEYQEFMRIGGASLGSGFRPATSEEAAQYGATAGQIDTSSGRFYPIQPPSGMTIETGPDGTTRIVQGPGVGAADTGKRTPDFVYTTNDEGQPVARPIAGTPAAAETEAQRSTLNASIGVGRDMLQTIESIVGRPAGDGQTAVKPDPALAGMLGLIEGRLPPRTQAQADLAAKMDQVSGRAFLEAFDTLKGGGQITEVEGQKATQALARLQRTQSPEAYQEALYEFADIVRRGIARSMNELNVLPEVAPAPKGSQADTGQSTGGRVRYDADGNRIQ